MKLITSCRRQSTTFSRGFTLVEVLAVVTLAGALAALAGEAFVTITSITRDTSRAQTTSVRLDAIIRLIRADAWRAVSIQTPDDATAVLDVPGGRRPGIVTWNFGHDGAVTRRVEPTTGDAALDTHRWEGFNLPLRLSTRDGSLVVASTQQVPGISDELILVSQMKLAARRQP